MYAHIEPLTSGPGPRRDQPAVGWVTIREVDGPAATRITLFDGTPGSATDTYQVMAIETGTAGGQHPTHARVAYFDGRQGPEQAAAEDFAGKQRLLPAVRDLSGLVSVWALRGPQFASVVCTLATSLAELDAVTRAVLATALLPGEDAALLPGPDRVQTHQVTGYQMAAETAFPAGGRR
jgi:hypothetical protein